MKVKELRKLASILAELYQIREDGQDLAVRLGFEDASDNLAALEQWILHQLPVVRSDLLAQCVPGLCQRLEEALNPPNDSIRQLKSII